ncbi:Anti-sigma-28 factor, FlgM [Roseimaritima multifibrata]|uniref:Anti-sigma-28 factor, FlgM n=1 Tax=Roseimaritima multifibrata TaxID=1930274 RepID=A0A517MLU5_9BACT|nr:flagellar biosynthesis anti-sigma factor FlgM [Roseimaritima multifibrata]QDS95868.1 Anti-sigma-28 factor, FlgM [Roseimaritima multifibrata]
MQIFGPIRVSTSQATQANNRITPPQPGQGSATRSAGPVDQLDISSAAKAAFGSAPTDAVAGGGEIRLDRVAEIRRAIADGSYDTPEKMDMAMSRMLDRFA